MRDGEPGNKGQGLEWRLRQVKYSRLQQTTAVQQRAETRQSTAED